MTRTEGAPSDRQCRVFGWPADHLAARRLGAKVCFNCL